MTRPLRDEGSERGQGVVLVALTMTMLLMSAGLAIDAGHLYSSRRTMQEAADAGAYAGAVVLYQQGTQTEARSAAVADTKRNGYSHGVDGFQVEVNIPPVAGPFAGNGRYVEVIIQGYGRTQLMPQAGPLTFMRVRGVGGAEPLNNQYAIIALDRGNVDGGFRVAPNADIHLRGGGILVNSTHPTAAWNQQTNACRFTIEPAPHGIHISGGSGSSWPTTGCPARGTPAYTAATSQPQRADPFAGFPKPSTTGMAVHHVMPSGGNVRLSPGVWNAQIRAMGGTTLYLEPGIYVLKAGMDVAGNGNAFSMSEDTTPACTSDCGVLLFNTHSNYPGPFRPGIDSCQSSRLVGNGQTDLRAMTTGPYRNMLFFQDPACANEMHIAGNGTFNGTGSLYMPTAPFRFSGNPATLHGSQLVARTVDIQNGNITINFDPSATAQPILPRLAE